MSLGVAQHIAGNILCEVIGVVLVNRGTVNSGLQYLWPLIVEAYRLDSATDLEASQCPCSQIRADRARCLHC